MELLSSFIDIVGYAYNRQVSVLVCVGQCATPYLVQHGYIFTKAKKERFESEGYYLLDSHILASPDLLVRYKIRALVTDRGMLVYLHPCENTKLVLGDFCSYVKSGSIASARKCIYCLDDRIDEIEFSPASFGIRPWFDITNLTNEGLRNRLSRLSLAEEIRLV